MKIFKLLNKIHILFFYKVVRFILRLDKVFIEVPDMEWVMYKAFFAMYCIQGIWFLILLRVLEIITRKTIPDFFENTLIDILLFMGIVSIFNYFTLIYKRKWLKYEEEFAEYSKTKNRVINIVIPAFYILSFALYGLAIEVSANIKIVDI